MNDSRKRKGSNKVAGQSDALERGRASCAERAWADAFELLSRADGQAALAGEDLELLAEAAYLTGRDEEFVKTLDRAHNAYLAAGAPTRAARCAFWAGLSLLFRGEAGRGTGWLASARRLVENEAADCVERGYLLLPAVEQRIGAGDHASAFETAAEVAAVGEKFHDVDLVACARHLQGRVRIGQGRVDEGLALLDEAMVALTTGAMSPLMTGLIYCSVIEACQNVYAFGRAREWTDVLAGWCAEQPQMVAFSRTCLVHRAEIMQVHGAWRDAIEEARRASAPHGPDVELQQPAAALYQEAEIHRLLGAFDAAEAAYRNASRAGFDPQPGLSLLRLVQGRNDAAAAAIRRGVGAIEDPLRRTRLLPAHVEIMLAVGDIEAARRASGDLSDIAARFDTGVLGAMAAQARGAVALAECDAGAALGALRHAFEAWQQAEAPYEAARVRVMMGLACRMLGDQEGAQLDFEAAGAVFERLGAAPDLARVATLTRRGSPDRPHGLTPRELQVLRLVAAGKTNKAVAAELFVSEKTVDRHVSNIFNKLDVPSRAAATAYAYEHKLV